MKKERTFDSAVLDKAIIFATNAHKNIERKGKGFPYIVHPIEAVSIAATLTNDQEILAAAALHDVIEDTDYTYEDLKEMFGERVANIVRNESDAVIQNKSEGDSWVERKTIAMKHLSEVPYESKIVAMGDKLSNMRAIYRDFLIEGDNVWNKFHVKDPKLHEWHYRGLANSLKELKGTMPYEEFLLLIGRTFNHLDHDLEIVREGNKLFLTGEINDITFDQIKNELRIKEETYLDFSKVTDFTFSSLRMFLRLKKEGYIFSFVNLPPETMSRFNESGLRSLFKCKLMPQPISLDNYYVSGDGYTAVSYFSKDGDKILKLYKDFVPLNKVELEKEMARNVLAMGLPTPIGGELVQYKNQYGIVFERIDKKISFSRACADNPDKLDELAKEFAEVATKLHNTQCFLSRFNPVVNKYLKVIDETDLLDDDQKRAVNKFLIMNDIDQTTCVHGDFHIGNVIINDKGDKLLIDLGDFGYGNPLIDIGTFYFVSHDYNEPRMYDLYHINKLQMLEFWDSFVNYYFKDEQDLDGCMKKIKAYACLTAMYFAVTYSDDTIPVKRYIKEWLLDNI